MLIVTTAMGTEKLKTAQFLMSSLTYSEEAKIKLNLLIDKYEAGRLSIRRETKELIFIDNETGKRAGVIWVGNKYFSYGNLYRYGSEDNKEWACSKPDIKTFKRIVKLEKSLDNTTDDQVSPNASKPATKRSSDEEVVLD
jgi:hypothetical protein